MMPSPDVSSLVETLSGYGFDEENISKLVGVSVAQLRGKYAPNVESGKLKQDAKLRETVYGQAVSGNINALLYLLKQRVDDNEVDTQRLSNITGLSRDRLSKLERSRVITKAGHNKWDLRDAVQRLILHYQSIAAGRASNEGGADLVAERAKLAKAQEENYSLKNAQLKGDLLPRSDVEDLIGSMFGHIRARMLALPSKLAPIAAMGLTQAEFREHITNGVHDALNELASTEVTIGRIVDHGKKPENGGDGPEVDGPIQGAAENDGKRVGGRQPRSVKRIQLRNREVAHKQG